MNINKEELQAFNRYRIKLLPEILKPEGYTTLAIDFFGRWHKRGYDYYFSDPPKEWGVNDKKKRGIIYYLKLIKDRMPMSLQIPIENLYKKFKGLSSSKRETIPNAEELTNKAIKLIKQKKYPFL